MSSNSATHVATQQSIKAYVDSNSGAGNPVVSGAVSGSTLTLTLDDASTVDVNVAALIDANPVVSGAVSGTNLVLTLDDASTVTIDATTLKNLDTSVTIAAPNWYQQYASPGTGSATPGAQINTTLPPSSANPYYFGTTLKRGYEFLFTASFNSETIDFGIWGGSTTYTPNSAGLSSLWTKKLRYGSSNDEIKHGSGNSDTVGFDLDADYSLSHGNTKLALRYDYSTMKLELWDRTDDRWRIITTASDAEDGNPVTISFANTTAGGGIPNFSVQQEQEWKILAQLTADADTTWRDGILTDTVLQRTTGLMPGQKMTLTTPTSWQNHFLGFDYSGALIGQTGVENQNTGCVQLSSAEKISEKIGFTINTLAERYGSGTLTDVMGGAKISFRYHTDNSFDLFDEDNEEVLFTKDADMDGTTVFMHMYASTNIGITNMFHAWTDDVMFSNVWYKHGLSPWYQGWWFTNAKFNGGTAVQKWGKYMYPGQELVWSHYQPTNNNTLLGIRNTGNSGWLRNLVFSQTDVTNGTGFDLTAAYTENENILLETDVGQGADELLLEDGYKLVLEDATLATVWALRYDKSDNKLKLWQLETAQGKETLVSTSNTAEDGNGIIIYGAGAGQGWIFDHRYYGWEYIHTPTNFPQPWGNWRLDRPTVNDTLKNDTAVRQLRALMPGYFMRWTTANTATSNFHGGWKTSNASSGQTNIDSDPWAMWNWGWRVNSSEQILELKGMTFNTSNADYDSGTGRWGDPDKGNTQIQLRYHPDNRIDLHDHTNNRIIATKDDDGDGSGIYFDVGIGTNLTNLSDNFFSGGDVLFGTSNFAPSFTIVTGFGAIENNQLETDELLSFDQTIAVGKRMIILPEFWGLKANWSDNQTIRIGWQKINSPFSGAGTNWDLLLYMTKRATASKATRIRLYTDPPNNTYISAGDVIMGTNITDKYIVFDRIATNSGRCMIFPTLASARIGVEDDNTSFYSGSAYLESDPTTLVLTGDLNLYMFCNAGTFDLPLVDSIEVITIPT